jgi:hypothetical protein
MIPVTTITRTTAKAMLPPSYHPSLIPCNRIFFGRYEAELSKLIQIYH